MLDVDVAIEFQVFFCSSSHKWTLLHLHQQTMLFGHKIELMNEKEKGKVNRIEQCLSLGVCVYVFMSYAKYGKYHTALWIFTEKFSSKNQKNY